MTLIRCPHCRRWFEPRNDDCRECGRDWSREAEEDARRAGREADYLRGEDPDLE